MHKFDPRHLERLLSPERRKSQNPDVILGALGLGPGMTFADIGAGPGFFTLPAAAMVGPTGKVYALDIAPEMLDYLGQRAAAAGITNVETLVSDENRLPLPDGTVDAALIANVLHECVEPVGFLRESARVLRSGGRIAIVEWRKEPMQMGPPLVERLAPEQVEDFLRGAGYGDVERFDVGSSHYGVRARKEVPARRVGASVVGADDTIVPLPDGPTLVVYDAQTGGVERYANPGHLAEQNRRPLATTLLIEKRIDVVCSVPLTFCPRSHQQAIAAGIRFVQVEPGTRFGDVIAGVTAGSLDLVNTLPEADLFQRVAVPSSDAPRPT